MSILKKHEQTIIAIILVLFNFLIKGIFLSENSLGGDEPFSVYLAQMNISTIIKLLSEGNNPPLYEILLHFWIKLFGISEFSVRSPSLLYSSITVMYIYTLGAKYLNKRVALYASILFIFSNYHILFAHEARVYSLLGLLTVISMYHFIGIVQYCLVDTKVENNFKSTIRMNLIILIIVNTLIIYSHFFGFFILITQFIFFTSNKYFISTYWKQLVLAASVIGLLYMPNISIVLARFVESSSKGTWVKAPNGIGSIYNMLRQFSNAPVVAVCNILILLSAFVKSIINKKKEQQNINNRFVVFWFVFIFFFMFGISFSIPMFLDRYVMPAAIAFSLLIGVSTDYLFRKPMYKFIIPIVICILFIATVSPNITNKRNVKETVDKIKDIRDSNTIVLICPSNFILNFAYYYNIEIFKDYNAKEIYSNINKSLILEDIYGINNINDIDFKKWNNIVFLDAAASFSFSNNNIKKQLDENYNLINKYKYYEIFNIFEYKRN